MKINLLRNSNNLLNGYVNVDNFVGEGKVQGDVTNLDSIVDDALADEIVAKNILQFYEYSKLVLIINGWIKKLRHKGSITIIVPDYRAICKGIVKDIIDVNTALPLLYGPQTHPLLCYKSSMSVDFIKQILIESGLVIEKIHLDDFQICITGYRP